MNDFTFYSPTKFIFGHIFKITKEEVIKDEEKFRKEELDVPNAGFDDWYLQRRWNAGYDDGCLGRHYT